MKYHLAASLLIALLFPLAIAAADPKPLTSDVSMEERLNEQVPLDLVFHDEDGNPVRLQGYFSDKPVILVLAYYRCPMLCTQVLNGLVESLRAISLNPGDQFRVVIVSFDAREGPELAAAKKASYVESYGRPQTAGGWHFLTGNQDSIDRLTTAVGFRYGYDSEKDQFVHASGVMILTPQGRIARYFYGIQYPPRDFRLSLVESSAGKIGTPGDRVLLVCYQYDPAGRKYTPAVMRFVRIGGVLTLLIMGSLLLRAWLKDWKRRRKIIACGP